MVARVATDDELRNVSRTWVISAEVATLFAESHRVVTC